MSGSTNRSFSRGAPMLTRMWVGKRPPRGRMVTPFRHNAPTTIAHRPNAAADAFYDKRAAVDRKICEIKNDLAIDHVPTANFGANAVDLALKISARNLLVLYRDRGLGLKMQLRVTTLRGRYLWVADRIVKHCDRMLLPLAAQSPLHLAPRPCSPSPLKNRQFRVFDSPHASPTWRGVFGGSASRMDPPWREEGRG